MDFGPYLRDLRRQRRLTQQQLADAVGIDFTYLSKIENARVDPPSEATIRRLAAALQTDPEEMLARAAKVSPELKEAAEQEPELALLLRTLTNRRLPADTYAKLRRIAEQAPEDYQ